MILKYATKGPPTKTLSNGIRIVYRCDFKSRFRIFVQFGVPLLSNQIQCQLEHDISVGDSLRIPKEPTP